MKPCEEFVYFECYFQTFANKTNNINWIFLGEN